MLTNLISQQKLQLFIRRKYSLLLEEVSVELSFKIKQKKENIHQSSYLSKTEMFGLINNKHKHRLALITLQIKEVLTVHLAVRTLQTSLVLKETLHLL